MKSTKLAFLLAIFAAHAYSEIGPIGEDATEDMICPNGGTYTEQRHRCPETVSLSPNVQCEPIGSYRGSRSPSKVTPVCYCEPSSRTIVMGCDAGATVHGVLKESVCRYNGSSHHSPRTYNPSDSETCEQENKNWCRDICNAKSPGINGLTPGAWDGVYGKVACCE